MAENVEPIKQLFDDLFGLLETLETQSMAVMELLKAEGIGTDEKLKPYLERAGNASSVKWRAARARMEYLLAPAKKDSSDVEKEKKKESDKHSGDKEETEKQTQKAGDDKPNAEQQAGNKESGDKQSGATNGDKQDVNKEEKDTEDRDKAAAKTKSEQPSNDGGKTDKSNLEGKTASKGKDSGEKSASAPLRWSDEGSAAKK